MGPDPFLRNEGNDMVDFLSKCFRNIAGPGGIGNKEAFNEIKN